MSELLNPDLSSQWVERLLSSQGALPAIEVGLKSRDMEAGFKRLCHVYGLLIAGLWEEAVCDQDLGSILSTALFSAQEAQEAQETHRQPDDSQRQPCSSAQPPAPSSLPVAIPSSRPRRQASVRQIDSHFQQSVLGPLVGTALQRAEMDRERTDHDSI